MRSAWPMRSMATRRQHMATNVVLKDCIAHGIRIVSNFGAANPPAAARRIAACQTISYPPVWCGGYMLPTARTRTARAAGEAARRIELELAAYLAGRARS